MVFQFSDNNLYNNFRPLTLTRPVSEMRFGILTISETWKKIISNYVDATYFYQTEDYLSEKYESTTNPDVTIAGNIKPCEDLVKAVLSLRDGQSLYKGDLWIASNGVNVNHKIQFDGEVLNVSFLWELFQKNDKAIEIDYKLLTENRTSQPISDTNQVIAPQNVFLEEGAKVECTMLNASNGPIYIGENAEVMEGCMIRGGFAISNNATLKMGAKVYGATTIGPHCKVGGEVSNSIFQAYSNKGHDGFLGNSIVGEWCNFGADTNSSNLKNNYGKVKIYSYLKNDLVQTDHTFCGVLMGDHSKTGINTMLNTATTVGVSSNIFGGEFPPKFIPSFSWGGFNESPKFKIEKAFEVAENMMKRRGVNLSQSDKKILTYIFKNNL